MRWPIVREKYPDRWVLVEALLAKSIDRKRHIEEMSVLSDFGETKDAWSNYKKYHFADPTRELYIFHTSVDVLEVIEQSYPRLWSV